MAFSRRMSAADRFRYDWITVPTMVCPCCHSVSRMLERRVGIRRVLHVDADEEAVRVGRLEDAPHVVDRGGAVDVEAELRQLERDVALDAGRDDLADDADVIGGRRAPRPSALATLSPR